MWQHDRMRIGRLRFAHEIELPCQRPVADCMEAIADLTGPPNSWTNEVRAKPFRGRLGRASGWIRWAQSSESGVAGKSAVVYIHGNRHSGPISRGAGAHANLPLADSGLPGVLHFVEIWTDFFWAYRGRLPFGVTSVIGPILGFGMILGWTRWAVWLNGRADKLMIKVLEHTFAGEESARVAADLVRAIRD